MLQGFLLLDMETLLIQEVQLHRFSKPEENSAKYIPITHKDMTRF